MTASRRPLIPPRSRWPLAVAALSQGAVYWGAKLLAEGWPHRDLTVALDGAVPFLPWTVVIYAGAYLFWVINYILAARQGDETCFRLLAADLLGKAVCFALFLLLPTTNVRPDVPADAPLGRALGLLYALDTPSNLFPSMHCFTSWLSWAALRGRKTVPGWYRAFSLAFALAIAASTLTTRQHVLADVAAGLALGELCWQTAGRAGLGDRYRRLWTRDKKAARAGAAH